MRFINGFMGKKMQFDDLRPEYIDQCAEIMSTTALWREYDVTFDRAKASFDQGIAEPAEIIKVALLDAKVLGFIWYNSTSGFYLGGYVRLLGVHEAHRGLQIGQQLLTLAEDNIVKTKSHMFLMVSDINVNAQRFYQRLGYQHVGAVPGFAIPTITEFIYWKRLK